MILTDYYRFEHLPDSKSKSRLDCVASTQNYNEFEQLRNKRGELFIYFCNVPESFSASAQRKADKIITTREGKSLSSVFVPDVTLPFAYGDVKGSSDAVLIVNNEGYTELEIFVARGKKNNRINLWNMLKDGELDNEISVLIKAAVADLATVKVTESVTQKVADLATKNVTNESKKCD